MRNRIRLWEGKVHPALPDIARTCKEFVEESRRHAGNSVELRQDRERFKSKLAEFKKRYPNLPAGPYATVYHLEASTRAPSQKDANYWRRFREPLWLAEKRRDAGDFAAYERISRIDEYFYRVTHGTGGVKPTKSDQDHITLLLMGLPLGLYDLPSEALADFFEDFCPCGAEHHADNLKHQRARLLEDLDEAEANHRATTRPRERWEVYGRDGFAAYPYRSSDNSVRVVCVYRLGQKVLCYVNERAEVQVLKEAPRPDNDLLSDLPRIFGVITLRELFDMFFPG